MGTFPSPRQADALAFSRMRLHRLRVRVCGRPSRTKFEQCGLGSVGFGSTLPQTSAAAPFEPTADVRASFVDAAEEVTSRGHLERGTVPVDQAHVDAVFEKVGEALGVVAETVIVDACDPQVVEGCREAAGAAARTLGDLGGVEGHGTLSA